MSFRSGFTDCSGRAGCPRRPTHNRSEEYDDYDDVLLRIRTLPPPLPAAGPQPGLGAGRSAQKYSGMAQEFRASAWERLEQGDMDQAYKKAWKLVAETVKAISAHHGSVIYTYQAIIEVVAELAQLVGRAGDTETQKWLNTAFVAASSLQNNYYETRMPVNLVRSGLRLCEELAQRLYQLFWPGGLPARTDALQ